MTLEDTLRAQLSHTLTQTNLEGLGTLYRGKVRDVYRDEDRLIMVTSDRVSAFDHVLGTIPFKGEILNRMALAWFQKTQDILPNHIVSTPDPNVIVAKPCSPYPVEFIVRGYITGSLWRDYQSGKAKAYELDFPEDLKKDQRFSAPILTPSTKAEHGQHDEPISRRAIVERGLLTQAQLEAAENAALALYQRGVQECQKRGLILVDTKYELGEDAEGKLVVIDEIHTPDSSRYWIADEYDRRFAAGEAQRMLDKENLRGWLMQTQGYQGDGPPPALSDEIRLTLSQRYMEAYALIVGEEFVPQVGDVAARIERNLSDAGLIKARPPS